jgi:hypothetical protein
MRTLLSTHERVAVVPEGPYVVGMIRKCCGA